MGADPRAVRVSVPVHFSPRNWFGLAPERLAFLRDGLARLTKDAAYLEAAAKLGVEVAYASGDEFEKQVREEDRAFKALVAELGDPGSCLRPIRTCSSCVRCPLQLPDYVVNNYFNTLGNLAVYLRLPKVRLRTYRRKVPAHAEIFAAGSQQEPSNMNKDQVKGKVKAAAGKVQEEAGKLVGSNKQQAKGLSKQVAGKAQEAVGDIKAVVRNLTKP